MSALERQLVARANALSAAVDAERGRTPPGTSIHTDVIAATIGALVAEVSASSDVMRRMRAVVAGESFLRMLYELGSQRSLPGVAPMVAFATEAVRDGYQDALLAARALGAAGRERWPEPLVLLEPMISPATYARGGRARVFGLLGSDGETAPLPFPVVLMPWYPREALNALSLLQHELGHDLDADLRITEELVPKIESRLDAIRAQPTDVAAWSGWTREIVADAFGALFGGVGFLLELADWAAVLDDETSPASVTHPFPAVRVATIAAMWERLGVVPSDAVCSPIERARARVSKSDRRLAAEVAALVIDEPLAALRRGCLRDLNPTVAVEYAVVEEAAAQLLKGATASEALSRVPHRLVPSVVRLWMDGSNKSPTEIVEIVFDALPSGRVRAARAIQEADFAVRVRSMLAPQVEEEGGDSNGLKRPPANLFEAARRISFVGATNDGLPALFQRYAADAPSKPKERIDVYYLSSTALAGLANPQRSLDDHVRLRDASLAALTPALMSRVARNWSILEHDQPFFFAAYWDADEPGGRIHVSTHGWGQDLKRAPSFDYQWPNGALQPNRVFRWYQAALRGLGEKGHLLARSCF